MFTQFAHRFLLFAIVVVVFSLVIHSSKTFDNVWFFFRSSPVGFSIHCCWTLSPNVHSAVCFRIVLAHWAMSSLSYIERVAQKQKLSKRKMEKKNYNAIKKTGRQKFIHRIILFCFHLSSSSLFFSLFHVVLGLFMCILVHACRSLSFSLISLSWLHFTTLPTFLTFWHSIFIGC